MKTKIKKRNDVTDSIIEKADCRISNITNDKEKNFIEIKR